MSNPYLNARQEWNERYGSYIKSARAWRWLALFSLLLAAVAVGGALWLASQSKIVPYVVEVGDGGETLRVYPARKDGISDERIIKSQIAQFVRDVRTVTSDSAVQAKFVRRAYAHLNSEFPAFRTVNQWFRNNVPFERATDKGTVIVTVKRILPLAENTWRVEWEEIDRNLQGVSVNATEMVGSISIIQGAEVTSDTLQYNPIGLLVEHFEWSTAFDAGH